MRFTALALGALGLAGFAVAETGTTSTLSIESRPLYGSVSQSIPPTPVFYVEVPTVTTHSVYSQSCSWGYFPISTTRQYVSCSSFWSGGISGGRSCTVTATWPGPGCSQTLCPSGFIPLEPTVTPGSYSCFPSPTLATRSPRWVAQFARATPAAVGPLEALPAAAREAHLDAKFAARATQGLDHAAGREAHLDAKFETLPELAREARVDAKFAPSLAITPEPRAAQITPPPFPICTFDLDKGQYICPEKAKRQALPICSFDLSKGEYVCPTTLPLCTFDLSKGEYICPKVAPRTVIPQDNAGVEGNSCHDCFDLIKGCWADCKGSEQCVRECACQQHRAHDACKRCDKNYWGVCGREETTTLKTMKA